MLGISPDDLRIGKSDERVELLVEMEVCKKYLICSLMASSS